MSRLQRDPGGPASAYPPADAVALRTAKVGRIYMAVALRIRLIPIWTHIYRYRTSVGARLVTADEFRSMPKE